jgi:hypothetical protein
MTPLLSNTTLTLTLQLSRYGQLEVSVATDAINLEAPPATKIKIKLDTDQGIYVSDYARVVKEGHNIEGYPITDEQFVWITRQVPIIQEFIRSFVSRAATTLLEEIT